MYTHYDQCSLWSNATDVSKALTQIPMPRCLGKIWSENWPLICPPKFSLSLQRIKETYGNMLWSGWNALNGTRLRQDLTRLFRAGSPLLWQHGFATYVLFACKKGTWSQKVGCLLFTIFSTAQNSSLAVRTQHPHAPFFSINMYRSGRELYSYGYVEALGCK